MVSQDGDQIERRAVQGRDADSTLAPPDASQRAETAGEILSAKGISKSYGAHEALSQVDFSINRGETVCVLGPSGSGKTTLLRCFNLLVQPTAGELYFKGDLIGSWRGVHGERMTAPGVDLTRYRSRVSMVFQQFELFPHLTACDNIALGPRHVLGVSAPAAKERAMELLRRVGLAGFADAHPRTLSGGQQQRVAIARALAMDPDLILFDEPTSALDWEMVGEVLAIMAELAADGMTMVIVTHELRFARQVSSRIVVMDNGRVIDQGSTGMMFESPGSARTREILGLD